MSRSELIRNRLFECIHNSEIDSSDLVQIFEHTGKILNATTVQGYANRYGINYNGALKRNPKAVKINELKIIIDFK